MGLVGATATPTMAKGVVSFMVLRHCTLWVSKSKHTYPLPSGYYRNHLKYMCTRLLNDQRKLTELITAAVYVTQTLTWE